MKKTLIIAMAATGLALAGPVAAHHPSPMTELIEEHMPTDALLQHNTMMDELDQGMVPMEGNSENGSMSGSVMDPADGARSSEGPGNSDSGSGEVIEENRWDVDMGGFGPAREPLLPE
jgi:hypothetical protein